MKLKGIVSYVVRDKLTGEIKDSYEQKNVVTDGYLFDLVVRGSTVGDNILISNDSRVPDRHNRVIETVYAVGFVVEGDTSPELFERDVENGIPTYVLWKSRFPAPQSLRTINTIALSRSTLLAFNDASCYVTLDVPCTQDVNEVLDVSYRIEFPETYTDGVSVHGTLALAQKISDLGDTFPEDRYLSMFSSLGSASKPFVNSNFSVLGGSLSRGRWDNEMTQVLVGNNYSNSTLSTTAYSLNRPSAYSTIHEWNFDRSWNYETGAVQGRIFGSMALKGGSSVNDPLIAAARIGDESTNIQPIFYHSRDSNGPLQDVNTLAIGAGSISTGGSWSGSTPELFRINIESSGETGVSRYDFAKRTHIGFVDNSYRERYEALPFLNSYTGQVSIEGGHGMDYLSTYSKSTEEIDDMTLLMYDPTGITILNVFTGEYEIYDNTSRADSQLALSDIRQVATDGISSDVLWIADGTAGLHRLTRSTGDVVSVSFADSFITSTNAYAVDFGKSGSIFAILNGGLVETLDGGVSWNVYGQDTGIKFAPQHIILGSYENVAYMRVCPDNDNKEMAIVVDTGVVWWSIADGGTSLEGRLDNSYTADTDTADGTIANSKNSLRVSKSGGLYTVIQRTSLTDTIYISSDVYGGLARRPSVQAASYTGVGGFLYSQDGNPLAIESGEILLGGPQSKYSIQNGTTGPTVPRGTAFVNHSHHTSSRYHPAIMLSNGLSISSGAIACELNSSEPSPGSGAMHNYTWKHYGWNNAGATWELDYFGTQPVDLSGGNRKVCRIGFDGTSWDFNGRAVVDVRQVDLRSSKRAQDFRSIAFSVSSSEPEDGYGHYVFDLAPELLSFQYYSGLADGNMRLRIDGSWYDAGPRPASGLKHRIFIRLKSTGHEIYVNGELNATVISHMPSVNNFMAMSIGGSAEAIYSNEPSVFSGQIENFQVFGCEATLGDVAQDFANALTDSSYSCLNGNLLTERVESERVWTSTGITDNLDSTYTIPEVPWSYSPTIVSHRDIDIIRAIIPYDDSAYFAGVGLESTELVDGISEQTEATLRTGAGELLLLDEGLVVSYRGTSYKYKINGTTTTVDMTESPISMPATVEYDYSNPTAIKMSINGAVVVQYSSVNMNSRFYDRTPMFCTSRYVTGTHTYGVSFINKLQLDNGSLIMHLPLDDLIIDDGKKATHTAQEDIDGGVTIGFQDNLGEPIQWNASDYYTFACCNGIMKDNIRDLRGSYSLYFKPIAFETTQFEPAIVPATNVSVSADTDGRFSGENTIRLGDSVLNTGVYHPFFSCIDSASPGAIQIFINGIEAVVTWAMSARYSGQTNLYASTASIQSAGIFGDNRRPTASDIVRINLANGSWLDRTVLSDNGSTISISTSPTQSTDRSNGNYLSPGGRLWIDPGIPDPGEVIIDPIDGVAVFNAADQGKTITGKYNYFFEE